MAQPDTFSYKGWLNSDSFMKRAFAVLGYYFVAGLMVSAAALIVILIFIGILAYFGILIANYV